MYSGSHIWCVCALSQRSSMTWACYNRYGSCLFSLATFLRVRCKKERCWAPLPWMQMSGLMTDCHRVSIHKQHPTVYLHKGAVLVWTAVLGPVCASFHWPPRSVSSIVSQCRSPAGAVPETNELFLFANNGSEVFPVISIAQVYCLWNKTPNRLIIILLSVVCLRRNKFVLGLVFCLLWHKCWFSFDSFSWGPKQS